ncbi:DUF1631 family protein [Gynuella sunshinyii]|uniref:Thymidine phosphorylase n=1 Tax=Gynuella sunshinyii YC6258 TaxID=1445510 RepID=A0A0C5VS01_9GAMM|nr:DUF1631 family protein [Gynuella sunshinyii]AJQ93049.1 hypothetical Protein YC6258_00999 [Gynuella sunshinyii YC6258]
MSSNVDTNIVMLKTAHKLDKLPEARITPAAKLIQDYLLEQMQLCLKDLFENADDLLFEIAEKAGSGSEQARYFDAMRGLRVRRKIIDAQFASKVREQVSDCLNKVLNDAAGLKERTVELGIVDNDQMERAVAIESMAAKAIDASGDAWLSFRERLNQVLPVKSYSKNECPLSPYQFGDSFFSSIDFDDWDMKVKLILFKLYDHHIGKQLPEMYFEANEKLRDQGILPDLDISHLRSRARRPAINANYLQNLMAASRGEGSLDMERGQQNGWQGDSMPVTGGAGFQAAYLMPNLNQLQQSVVSTSSNLPVAPAELKQWSQNITQQVLESAKSPIDSDIINLVAMLFEFILEERDLLPQMKQLMARMQIPIIKVALLERSFFDDNQHVARRLLNIMTRSAVGWQADERIDEDPMLAYMEDIVTRLTKEFDDDLQIFHEELQKFESFLDEYQHKRVIYEARLTTAEVQRYEEEKQRDWAREFLNEVLDVAVIPEAIQKLLSTHWYKVLYHTYSRHGEGDQWRNAKRVVTELVWSLQPGVTTHSRERFFAVTPKILLALRKGLTALKLDNGEISRWMSMIDDLHLQEISKHEAPKPEVTRQFQKVQHELKQAQIKPASSFEPEPEPVVPESVDYLARARSLQQGLWYELLQMNGKWLRCHLLTVLGDGERFIFTDRTGEKVADRSLYGLATAMANGKFRQIDDQPIIDRALDTVIDQLSSQAV